MYIAALDFKIFYFMVLSMLKTLQEGMADITRKKAQKDTQTNLGRGYYE
jgi:hypothetical protein